MFKWYVGLLPFYAVALLAAKKLPKYKIADNLVGIDVFKGHVIAWFVKEPSDKGTTE